MNYLSNLNLSKQTLNAMVESCPNILELSDKEINEKIYILKKVNCSKEHIRNIVSSNPNYLDKTNGEILNLIEKLIKLGFKTLNILFDANPYILNLEPFEIDGYINERVKNGEILEDIVDDLDSNPYLFSEM